MNKEKLERFMANRRCTLLGIGPMSKNCVDAAIELSNEHEIPLKMVASRRQIEAEEFGGGYVNNWTTESFAEYVINKDKKGKIILARDHGGPWQNTKEKTEQMSLRKAMASAKKSYQADIDSGFEVIHLDPSIDPFGHPSTDEVLERLFDLYEFCWQAAQAKKQEILFEIGTEEQNGSTNTAEEMEYVLSKVFEFCRKHNFIKPSFVVVQAGTKVAETRNVGSFESPFRIADELPVEIQIPKMIDISKKYHFFIKAHNTDYLSDESLSWYPRLEIHSANVAPEFGVVETKSFIELLEENELYELAEQFVQVAHDSKKWEKWMLPDSKADKRQKAIIAGHYVFSNPRFIEIKQIAQSKLSDKGINVDNYLKERVKKSILRYLKLFRLLRLN